MSHSSVDAMTNSMIFLPTNLGLCAHKHFFGPLKVKDEHREKNRKLLNLRETSLECKHAHTAGQRLHLVYDDTNFYLTLFPHSAVAIPAPDVDSHSTYIPFSDKKERPNHAGTIANGHKLYIKIEVRSGQAKHRYGTRKM